MLTELNRDAATSEAFRKLQEEGLDRPASLPATPSEDTGTVQEKPQPTSQPTATPEVIDVKALEERIRREEQSKRDKMIHEALMKKEAEDKVRYEREKLEQADRHALENMDDEDAGRYWKQRAAEQAKAAQESLARQQAELSSSQQDIQRRYNAGLAKMPTAELRAQLEEMAKDPTKVNSLDSFEDAVTELLAEHKAELRLAQKLKAAQEAATRDSTAQVAELAAPVTGTGLPQSSTKRQLSADENLSQGLAEALAATAKR
jgi:hypothetical protein